MKKLFVLTAIAASIATGATAMVDSSGNLSEIQHYAPNADVSTLTDREIIVLLNIIHGGDNEGQKGSRVRSWFRVNG